MMNEHKSDIIAAVCKDLGKSLPTEVQASEIGLVSTELDEAISNLKSWVLPEKVYTPLSSKPASSYVYKDPLGVVLIISPWNYPFNLAMVPLIGAITAGNCVMLKTARQSIHTSACICELLPKYLDMRYFAIETKGGAQMIKEMLKLKWDHIFFTGSVSVGRSVYKKAAKHLTPVTLELGGKNPCIVDSTIDLRLAARRIAWGKFFNTGQTCIGIDYLLVEGGRENDLITHLTAEIRNFYGDNPKTSESYGRLISEDHTVKLQALLDGCDVVLGGEVDVAAKYISPTIVLKPALDSKIMTDEIFGPILPIITIPSVDEALSFIRDRPKPLALYLFSANKETQRKVLLTTQSGTAVINDSLVQFTNSNLPFGGVGESGMGAYHGKLTFDTFAHRKAVVINSAQKMLDVPFRYPPYTDNKHKIITTFTSTSY